jgi:hypothetical protein
MVKKGQNGVGQRSITPWKMIFFLAFGWVPEDKDRVRVWPICGYLPCVNPEHLELEARSAGSGFRERMLFYGFASKFLSSTEIDNQHCVPVPRELVDETARELGTFGFWRYWGPFQTGDIGERTFDKLAGAAALSLEKLGWAFYPAYNAGHEPEISCRNQSDCINPHHLLDQILERSQHSWHRHSVVTNFKVSPQKWFGSKHLDVSD